MSWVNYNTYETESDTETDTTENDDEERREYILTQDDKMLLYMLIHELIKMINDNIISFSETGYFIYEDKQGIKTNSKILYKLLYNNGQIGNIIRNAIGDTRIFKFYKLDEYDNDIDEDEDEDEINEILRLRDYDFNKEDVEYIKSLIDSQNLHINKKHTIARFFNLCWVYY